MTLTGHAHGEPLLCPLPLAACADGVLLALQALAPEAGKLAGLRGSQLLTERAALMGLNRNGRIAPGGSCRLLDTADGVLAVNLAREEDWALLPAWLESAGLSGEADDWGNLAEAVRQHGGAELAARGRLLGLPLSQSDYHFIKPNWYKQLSSGTRNNINNRRPLVLDLSSLWAGPLCSHLLQTLGARVIKLESASRPDGARQGHADFYNLLNAGKASASLDLASASGRKQLLKLIRQADIVVESARPRGLRQMGIVAEDLVREIPGLTWISITGYGREGAAGEWVGFGDDAGVAAGLSEVMRCVTGESLFVGDAIADPLTGMHAALAAWHSHIHGGGRLIDLSLRDVTAHCAGFDLSDPANPCEALRQRYADWVQMIRPEDIRPPQPRYANQAARPLGADNEAIFAEFGL